MQTRLPRAVVLLAWALAAANLYHVRVADPDLWWLLQGGRDIVQSGTVYQADGYSFTASGQVQVNAEWLTQVLLWQSYARGGVAGLVALKVAFGLVFALLFDRLLRLHTDDDRVRLPALVLGTHMVGRFLLLRPQLVSFVLMAVLLIVLERRRRGASPQALLLLPFVFLAWANLHGGWIAGLGVAAYVACLAPVIDRPRKPAIDPLAVVTVAWAAAATVLTPFGMRLYGSLAVQAADPLAKRHIQEWLPPAFWPPDWNALLLAAVLGLAVVTALKCREAERRDIVLVAVFGAAACWSVRHLPLFAIIAVPIVARWTAAWTRRAGPRGMDARLAAAGSLAIVPALFAAGVVMADPAPHLRIVDDNYRGFPREAVAVLRQQRAGGNVWTELAWGGYVSWALAPAWRVSIDGRNASVYPIEVVREHLELFASDQPDLARLARYPVDVCLISPERALARRLAADPGWETVYLDTRAIILRNRSSSRVPAVSMNGVSIPARPAPLLFPGKGGDPF